MLNSCHLERLFAGVFSLILCGTGTFNFSKLTVFFLSDVVGFLVRICGLCDSFIFNGKPSSSCRLKFVLAV